MQSAIRKVALPAVDLACDAGLFRLAGRFYAGRGVIFALHRVVEAGSPLLHPVHMVHADVLDDLLTTVRALGWEIVDLDEVRRRLMGGTGGRFACFTCDDGYADNLTVALPVFRRHNAPFCVYVATGIVERSAFYWWGALMELILGSQRVSLPPIGDAPGQTLHTATFSEKVSAFRMISAASHQCGDASLAALAEMFHTAGVDPRSILDRDALTLSQLRQLASDPLVTIGSHCATHGRLSAMPEDEARADIEKGRHTLEQWLEMEIRHFAYPFGRSDSCGEREFALAAGVGFRTAVTTRQGNLFPAHRDFLHCLPRRSVPLNRLKAHAVLFGVQTLFERSRRFQTN